MAVLKEFTDGVDLTELGRAFQSVTVLGVSVKFRCATLDCAILTPNSEICVALMVSAPIYVAQKQMSY